MSGKNKKWIKYDWVCDVHRLLNKNYAHSRLLQDSLSKRSSSQGFWYFRFYFRWLVFSSIGISKKSNQNSNIKNFKVFVFFQNNLKLELVLVWLYQSLLRTQRTFTFGFWHIHFCLVLRTIWFTILVCKCVMLSSRKFEIFIVVIFSEWTYDILTIIFRTDYNTAATVIGSFGISLGTVVMTPVSVYVTDNFGFRNRFRVAGKAHLHAGTILQDPDLIIFSALMQAAMTLPAVLLWGQPFEPEKEKGEANKEEKPTEETELVAQNKTEEEKEPEDDFNLCTDISFWCWLFGTTFWSLGT